VPFFGAARGWLERRWISLPILIQACQICSTVKSRRSREPDRAPRELGVDGPHAPAIWFRVLMAVVATSGRS
jgi:hypothetical protein